MFAALVLSLALPQSPIAQSPATIPLEAFRFPEPVAEATFAPFVDATGTPQSIQIAAAQAADFDGDGNRDTWFLAGAGPRLGELAILTAQTAALGRYVPFGSVPAGAWLGGTTFRRAGVPDVVLLADPARPWPDLLFYQPGATDPRAGSFMVVPSTIYLGLDLRDLASFDADSDGNDDLVATLDLRNAGNVVGTRFLVLHFGLGPFGHSLLATAAIDLPLPGLTAAGADLDGDLRTDLVVHADGFGVVGLVDNGAGSFAFRSYLPLGAGMVRDCAIADFDGDGRDDQAIAIAQGTFVVLTDASGDTQLALPSPATVGALGNLAAIDVDQDGRTDLVGLPHQGGDLAIWRFDALTRSFTTESLSPPASAPEVQSGIGSVGVALLQADLDGDGARDLAWQIPTADRWLSLLATTHDQAPRSITVATLGQTSAIGFALQQFTVQLPDHLLSSGVPEVEFAVFVEDPATGELVYWTRDVLPMPVGTTTLTVPMQIMIDPLNQQWVWQSLVTRHPLTNEITAFGRTVVSVHGKDGPARRRATLTTWDGHGQNGPNGSAVGVRWNVVAAPPLPKSDSQLLPWD